MQEEEPITQGGPPAGDDEGDRPGQGDGNQTGDPPGQGGGLKGDPQEVVVAKATRRAEMVARSNLSTRNSAGLAP